VRDQIGILRSKLPERLLDHRHQPLLVLVERGSDARGLEADFLCLAKVQPEPPPDDPDRFDLTAAGGEDS
jgi:hypothetical protein